VPLALRFRLQPNATGGADLASPGADVASLVKPVKPKPKPKRAAPIVRACVREHSDVAAPSSDFSSAVADAIDGYRPVTTGSGAGGGGVAERRRSGGTSEWAEQRKEEAAAASDSDGSGRASEADSESEEQEGSEEVEDTSDGADLACWCAHRISRLGREDGWADPAPPRPDHC
jgi:hypothetical protein